MVAHVSVRTITTLLRAIRIGLVLAVPAVAVTFVVNTPQVEKQLPVPINSPAALNTTEAGRELAWYAPLWERDLRQPPIPPAPVPEPTAPVVPSEAPRLVATFVDERQRFAHLIDRDGKLLFKEINDEVAGYRVAAIEPGRVELEAGTRTMWIEVPKRKE